MGKVIIHATMSLDGFIATPEDGMDWVFKYEGSDDVAKEVMGTTGAVVLGRRTFDVSIRNNQLPYGGAVRVPQFVVTHKARKPMTIGGLVFTFVTEGVARAVEQAKTAAGDKNVSLLGASIDQQCLKLGLADELDIHVLPILLSEGIRLFDHRGTEAIELEKTWVVSSPGMTSFRFEVVTNKKARLHKS